MFVVYSADKCCLLFHKSGTEISYDSKNGQRNGFLYLNHSNILLSLCCTNNRFS